MWHPAGRVVAHRLRRAPTEKPGKLVKNDQQRPLVRGTVEEKKARLEELAKVNAVQWCVEILGSASERSFSVPVGSRRGSRQSC